MVLHFQMMCIKRLPVPKSRSYRMPVSAFGNIFMLLIITDQFSLNQSLLTDLKKTRAKLRKLNPHWHSRTNLTLNTASFKDYSTTLKPLNMGKSWSKDLTVEGMEVRISSKWRVMSVLFNSNLALGKSPVWQFGVFRIGWVNLRGVWTLEICMKQYWTYLFSVMYMYVCLCVGECWHECIYVCGHGLCIHMFHCTKLFRTNLNV